jgi:hypothetical protein
VDLYMDGVFMGSTNGNTGPLGAPGQLVLGAQQTMNYFLTGDIAEVKIFSSALSDSDRTAEESELECKYGIAGTMTPPVTPSELTGTPGNHVISLTWAANAGDDTYNLTWSTNQNGPFAPLAVNLAVTTYLDTNALSSLTNYYVVSAANHCNISSNSTPVGVFLPNPPALTFTNVSSNSLTISWPISDETWQLQFATNLTPPAIWLPVTNIVETNGQQLSVTVPVDSGNRFFRLSVP